MCMQKTYHASVLTVFFLLAVLLVSCSPRFSSLEQALASYFDADVSSITITQFLDHKFALFYLTENGGRWLGVVEMSHPLFRDWQVDRSSGLLKVEPDISPGFTVGSGPTRDEIVSYGYTTNSDADEAQIYLQNTTVISTSITKGDFMAVWTENALPTTVYVVKDGEIIEVWQDVEIAPVAP